MRVHRMVVWACACFLLVVVGSFAGQVKAADTAASVNEAKTWLDKIASSEKTVSYEGNFIFRRDDQLVAMHLIHVVDQTGERERLSSLSFAKCWVR